jgi:hypothetical protein
MQFRPKRFYQPHSKIFRGRNSSYFHYPGRRSVRSSLTLSWATNILPLQGRKMCTKDGDLIELIAMLSIFQLRTLGTPNLKL